MNTTSLIDYTSKFVNYSTKQYGQVWIVFDKDNFSDEQFNNAILSNSFNVAWSNPSFELWLLLHFENVTTKLTNEQIIKKLNSHFRKKGLQPYSKNDINIFNNVTENGDLSLAIKYSKDLLDLNVSNTPANSSPCTSMYLLLNELIQFIDK